MNQAAIVSPQLAFGEYTVTFSLPGFKTLNIEGVRVQLGATATVNGELEVATVAETITVLSQEPTIDLEQALVAGKLQHAGVRRASLQPEPARCHDDDARRVCDQL